MPLINFSGLASGIDSESLIEATVEARRSTRVEPKEKEVTELEGANTALQELTTLLNDFKTQLLDFTSLNGGGVSKTVSSSDETAVTAVASNAATGGTYTITAIDQLATNHTYTFTEGISDPTAAIMGAGEEGQLDVTIGSESFSLSVDDTTTFNDLVNDFNAATDKGSAQLINVAAPGQTADYRLVITSNNVGEENGLITIDTTTNVTASPNLDTYLDSVAADAVDIPAQNALFTLQGVGQIERSSNTINDVIQGVTLSLEDANITTSVTIQVKNDSSGTESAVRTLIEKYNEIVEFISENNEVTRNDSGREVENIFGPLANTRVDDGALTALRGKITASSYDITTNAVRIFADLGITTARDGTLAFNADNFQEALSNEPDSVNEILKKFADETAVSGGLIEQYTRFNGLIDTIENANTKRIENLNDQIARAEEFIEKEATQIRLRFARLEANISRMQSQQAALTSALAGLGGGGGG